MHLGDAPGCSLAGPLPPSIPAEVLRSGGSWNRHLDAVLRARGPSVD